MKIKAPVPIHTKDSHCSYCGTKFTEQENWPRKCFICWNESYKNPIPIVVALVPVFLHPNAQCSWLIEQRAIEPQKGGWALPSGYVNFGETWQDAVVRELQEEVGLETKPEDWKLVTIVTPASGNMLIFCAHNGVKKEDIKFEVNEEVSAIDFPVLPEHQELCFPSHNAVWRMYYEFLDWRQATLPLPAPQSIK